jgi:hypothetical protein
MQRIVPERVKGFLIGREQANEVLNEVFFGVRCSSSWMSQQRKQKFRISFGTRSRLIKSFTRSIKKPKYRAQFGACSRLMESFSGSIKSRSSGFHLVLVAD